MLRLRLGILAVCLPRRCLSRFSRACALGETPLVVIAHDVLQRDQRALSKLPGGRNPRRRWARVKPQDHRHRNTLQMKLPQRAL
jgi:hypothetical protein